ncbi:membrane-associated sensor domain-containing protein [uncultured Photobacterium sp.]|uniref:GGDEF domain-containing protein n=1 Tax=uncultured Photobacterium sp. TaxID=173973 RepID=UPI00262E1D0A|nr:membrane-associated sensor domain-containing protein [uncultured Photobacterium sp.]
MIRHIDSRSNGLGYLEQQRFERQVQGWKLITATSVLLLGLVAVELFWAEPAISSEVKSAFSGVVAVLGLVALLLWVVVQFIPIKVSWKSVSVALAGLLGIGWAVLFPLLLHEAYFSTLYVYGDLFVFLSVVAFFSYRPAMYLAVLPVLGSFFFTGIYSELEHEAISFLSLASRLLIAIVIRECLYHWFHSSVLHEFEEKRLRKELASVALVDPVTGLQNNRHFELMLDREIMAARRHNSDLTLMIVSVEPMRLYTMTCGYQAYEDLLKRVAKGLRRGIYRPRDFISRVGSDEFAIILPDTDMDGAQVVAPRIQRHVHRCCDYLVKLDLEEPVRVMISILEWTPDCSSSQMSKSMFDAINELRVQYENGDATSGDIVARYERLQKADLN